MMRRRFLPLVLVATLAVVGCSEAAPERSGPAVADTEDGTADEPATADEPGTADGAEARDDGTPPDDGATPGPPPEIPPLHPVIDGWDETVVTIATADGSRTTVDAKIAATDQQRQRGLMEVEDLPAGIGMLFVFDDLRTGGFWMRNTLVPLDIAYIDGDGAIGTILAMDPCTAEAAQDCPTYVPERPYRTALEVPQGWFADNGVAVGDTVTWSS